MTEWDVTVGDSLAVLAELAPASVDAIVTDPPYGLAFMGNQWDRFRAREFQEWCEAWATGAVRALKPGGYLLAFGGTRTYHRLAAGLEDAGLEIRDTLAWLFGSGFPKSLNLTGDHAGRGTALKPAYEPVVVARAPLAGTVAATVNEHGTGALNIDACRIEGVAPDRRPGGDTFGSDRTYAQDATTLGMERAGYDGARGRWPANVALDAAAAELLDEQSGDLAPGNMPARRSAGVGGYHGWPTGTEGERIPLDGGGASRFFYCAKADGPERNAGLDDFAAAAAGVGDNRPSGDFGQRLDGRPERTSRNVHPTVKPIDLMRWLVRLVTPAGGLVVDPFTGSGTTGIAAVLEGLRFHGIERDPDYAAIARARIQWWAAHPAGVGVDVDAAATAAAARRKRADAGQSSLFEEPAA